MADPLFTALSGVQASRNRALASANNLANANTPGYRAQRAESASGPGGSGVQTAAVTTLSAPGGLVPTGNPLDLAINGPGFFQVADGEGNVTYTRGGSFAPDANGRLTNPQGMALQPPVEIPQGAVSVSVGADGTVSARMPDGANAEAGRIETATFSNPAGLSREGGNRLAAAGASGAPQAGQPGTGGRGTIVQGFLEAPNTDTAREMVNLRAEANAAAANVATARTADAMTKTAIDLVG